MEEIRKVYNSKAAEADFSAERKRAEMALADITKRIPRNEPLLKRNLEKNAALTAWLLHKAAVTGLSGLEVIDGRFSLQDDIMWALHAFMTEEVWEKLRPLLKKYSAADFALAAYLAEPDAYTTVTPADSVIRLALDILAIRPGDRVADITCGFGAFLTAAALHEPQAEYTGYRSDGIMQGIATVRAELAEVNVRLVSDSVFVLQANGRLPRYSRLFSTYPFGPKERNVRFNARLLENLPEDVPAPSRETSMDWYVNLHLEQMLEEDGRAVVIMSNAGTWNDSDAQMREYFVAHGYIESVIELPPRLFAATPDACTMLVLSHGNRQVRLVNASEKFQEGRRVNEFGEAEIYEILDALQADGASSRTFSAEELGSRKFKLSLRMYQEEGDTVPFASVIRRITRGAPAGARERDAMETAEETGIHYLSTASIQDGLIDPDLPSLHTVPKGYERYFVENNNLILSKNGYPYKLAIASVQPGEQIIACGNLYIIELDEEKVNPFYLQAFLVSEQGSRLLKRISGGGSIPNISVSSLYEAQIPLPPLEEQDRIAARYQAVLQEIAEYRARLKEATEQARHIYDSEF